MDGYRADSNSLRGGRCGSGGLPPVLNSLPVACDPRSGPWSRALDSWCMVCLLLPRRRGLGFINEKARGALSKRGWRVNRLSIRGVREVVRRGCGALQDVASRCAWGRSGRISAPTARGKFHPASKLMTGLFPPDFGEVVFDGGGIHRPATVPDHPEGDPALFQSPTSSPHDGLRERPGGPVRSPREQPGPVRRPADTRPSPPSAGDLSPVGLAEKTSCPHRSFPTGTRAARDRPSPSPRVPAS